MRTTEQVQQEVNQVIFQLGNVQIAKFNAEKTQEGLLKRLSELDAEMKQVKAVQEELDKQKAHSAKTEETPAENQQG